MGFASRVLSVVAAGTLVFSGAACSSDDNDGVDGNNGTDTEAVDEEARDAMVADLLATSEDDDMTDEQGECLVDGMIAALGEDETQAFVDDPDAWGGEQVEIAFEEGDGEMTEAMSALEDEFVECGIDDGADVEIDPDVEVDVEDADDES